MVGVADDPWLTPADAEAELGRLGKRKSAQTIIRWLPSLPPEQIRKHQTPGGRPRYEVRRSAILKKAKVAEPGEDRIQAFANADEVALLRDELNRVRLALDEVTRDRDRIRAELVAVQESAYHMTLAVQAHLTPRTAND